MLSYERLEKGKKEARIGLDSEQDIINRVNFDDRFCHAMRECLRRLGFAPQVIA